MTVFFIPNYSEIKQVHAWVPPQPCSLMLQLELHTNQKIKIDFLPNLDDDLIPYTTPRRIYLNDAMLPLQSKAEKEILCLLQQFIDDNLLGHKEGLENLVAKEMIAFFH